MTTKTLGQVLYDEASGNHKRLRLLAPWTALDAFDRAHYERMAQAVAAVVRERDARLADGYPECWQATQIAVAIRRQSA